MITFDVLGTPMPQGSKKAFVANGRAILKEAGGGHAAWRNAVADKARAVGHRFTGAVAVSVTFRFQMPKSRTKAQRSAGTIAKTTAPDIDKLLRAVFDGLMAGGLLADDALIGAVSSRKVEVVDGWIGATVIVHDLSSECRQLDVS